MRVIATKHFVSRWTRRVGKFEPEVIEAVRKAIQFGNARTHETWGESIYVPVQYGSSKLIVMGHAVGRKTFLMQTVGRRSTGWDKMDLNVPKEMKRHICMVCGDPCIPIRTGDGWFNEEKGIKETVIVCFNCAKKIGEKVFKVASSNTDQYVREVTKWSTLSTTIRSDAM